MTAIFGLISWIAAGLLVVAAVASPTAPNGVHNISLLVVRLCLMIGAGTLAIIGSIFFAASAIIAAIKDSSNYANRLAMRLADRD